MLSPHESAGVPLSGLLEVPVRVLPLVTHSEHTPALVRVPIENHMRAHKGLWLGLGMAREALGGPLSGRLVVVVGWGGGWQEGAPGVSTASVKRVAGWEWLFRLDGRGRWKGFCYSLP